MKIRILTYDPAKGKGTYETQSGEIRPFRYDEFENQKMLPPGSRATLEKGVIRPISPGFWDKIKEGVKKWR